MSSNVNEQMTLAEKLAGIRKMLQVIRKNKSGFNYKYVSEDELMAKLHAGMEKYRVSLMPEIRKDTLVVTPISYTKTKATKNGGTVTEQVNEVLVHAEMVYRWIDLDSSATIEIPWVMVGQQADASQAVGSALSYTNRYFPLKFFQIATPEDDPDNWRSKKQAAEQEEALQLCAAIASEIDELLGGYLGQFVDEEARKKARKDVSALVKNYAKSGNYYEIQKPDVANELLVKVKEMIGGTTR